MLKYLYMFHNEQADLKLGSDFTFTFTFVQIDLHSSEVTTSQRDKHATHTKTQHTSVKGQQSVCVAVCCGVPPTATSPLRSGQAVGLSKGGGTQQGNVVLLYRPIK